MEYTIVAKTGMTEHWKAFPKCTSHGPRTGSGVLPL